MRDWVLIGNEPFTRQAVLDTGAPACVVPKRIWANLDVAGEVAWEAGAPADVPLAALPSITVLGGRHRFRLGRVRLELIDLTGGRLAPRAVRAICTEDAVAVEPGGPPQVPLLVELGDALRGRVLLVQTSEDGARTSATIQEA